MPMRFTLKICLAALITAALPLAVAQAPTRASLAGTYEGNQMEVAAELILKPDGHFQFQLAYGALGEEAEGNWEIRPGVVLLTTAPAVKPPQFVVVSDIPDSKPGLWIKIDHPVMEGARQRIDLIYAPGPDGKPVEPDEQEVADDGSVPIPAGRHPIAFIPQVPVYPIPGKPIPLAGTGGHHVTLRFEPNDIGKADFRYQPLTIQNGVLEMTRRDLGLTLHFKRRR